MEEKKEQKKWEIPKIAIEIGIVVILAFFVFAGSAFAYAGFYQNTIVPGVKVGKLDLSGYTVEEAYKHIRDQFDVLENQGIGFVYKDHRVQIPSLITSPDDPDLAYELIMYDPYDILQSAYRVGHADNIFDRFKEQFSAKVLGYQVPVAIDVYDDEVKNALQRGFKDYETLAKDADLVIHSPSDIEILPESAGEEFNYDLAVGQLKNNLADLNFAADIPLVLKEKQPEIFSWDIQTMLPQIQDLLKADKVVLKYEEESWDIPLKQYESFLALKPVDNAAVITMDTQNFEDYMQTIKDEVDVSAKNARFQISDTGKVSEFQKAQNGKEVDVHATANALLNAMKSGGDEISSELVLTETEPTIKEVDNNLGITDMIGRGTSDFSGSPANRRHNIRVGADTLNGILIEPGDTFSLITALGAIDASNGYRQELVIKGNETIPEYGGGLCQIGTTIFRTALNAGVPITERRNHSYAVSYYKPYGTDATIYSPRPDFSFVNDTGNYILIQTRMEGNELIFEFWGTDDGRKTEVTDPVQYNWVAPPPTKIVYTSDLPAGKKRCTESAHAGLSAYFDRTVTMEGGEVREERFTSHYRPWQAVCLVGVDPSDPSQQPGEPVAPPEEKAEVPVENAESPAAENNEAQVTE